MQELVQSTYSGQVGSRWVGYGSNLKKVPVYANAADINIRFLGIFDTVDGRGLQLQNPDVASTAIDPRFVQQTLHFVAAHEYRPGFDVTSALPYADAKIANIDERYLPGAHSDVGGSQPQTEAYEAGSGRMKFDDLQDLALALMRYKAMKYGAEFKPINAEDRFQVDPRLAIEEELWQTQIHDSRHYPETYLIPETIRRVWRGVMDYGNPYESFDRRERDVYFGDGSHALLKEDELEKRWRESNGYSDVIKEGDNLPGARKQPACVETRTCVQ